MKWLEIDQDNLQMKFSASNIDVSSLSPNTLGSKIEACERERQREVPPQKKMVILSILARLSKKQF